MVYRFISLLFLLFSVCFAFSKYPSHFQFENNKPDQDLKEIFDELDNKKRQPNQVKENLNLNLKKINSSEDLSQKDEVQDSENEEEVVEEFSGRSQIGLSQDKDLTPLIQEAFFSKNRAQRELNVYMEDQRELQLEDESTTVRLDGVEVRLEKSKENE